MSNQARTKYEFGQFFVDPSKRLLSRDGESVALTPKCFEILLTLIESCGEVVTKDHLIKRVWPDTYVEEGNLTYNISVLRRALGERAGKHPTKTYDSAPTSRGAEKTRRHPRHARLTDRQAETDCRSTSLPVVHLAAEGEKSVYDYVAQ